MFIIIALVFVFRDVKNEEFDAVEEVEVVQDNANRVAKVNETYYDDPNAFCTIINHLGFPKERK